MNIKHTPIPVSKALNKLGNDIKTARKRRRITTLLAAERAGISRSTLVKIEKGDENVSIGAYAKIVFILGLITQLSDLADASKDKLGLSLETELLPKRIRHKKKV